MVNITKNQHYLPQEYLKQWCSEDGSFAVATRKGIVTSRNVRNFGAENNMYAFVDIAPQELNFLRRAISQIVTFSHPVIEALFVPTYLVVLFFRIEKQDWNDEYAKEYDEFSKLNLSKIRRSTYNKLRDAAEGRTSLTQEEKDAMRCSFASGFETFETSVENAALPVLRNVRNGDLSDLKDDKKLLRLLTYLVNQCFRGPDYLRMIQEQLPDEIVADGGTAELARYMRYIQPLWVAHNLVVNRKERKVVVVRNKTDLEFITTDTPYAIYGDASQRRTPLITYYPLTPRMALFFGYSSSVNKLVTMKYGREIVDRKFVDWLNREVLSSARYFVFATKESVIKENDYNLLDKTVPSVMYA